MAHILQQSPAHANPGSHRYVAFAGTRSGMLPFRVLIVEDNRDGADSLALVVRAWGYQVRVAYDAPSALADAASFLPDVVLSDIGMPGMSGFSLAEKLAGKGVLLIATTAYGDEATRRSAKESGFQEHLVKPIDLEALHAFLEDHRQAIGSRGVSG
jgi:CheY-like chemotaxis protein